MESRVLKSFRPSPRVENDARSALVRQAGAILARLGHRNPGRVLEVVASLTPSLACIAKDAAVPLLSDITDDGTPYEFSLGFQPGEVAFRLLWEAQAPVGLACPEELWAAAETVTRTAVRRWGVVTEPLDRIKDAFRPRPERPARFAMWHALTFDASGGFLLKAYVNPAAAEQPREATLEALRRLGHERLAASVERLLAAWPEDRIAYFSVDLAAPEASRTKVYLAHPGTTCDLLEKRLDGLGAYRAGEASGLIRRLGAGDGPFPRRPVLTCLAGRIGRDEPNVTVHFPVRCYVGRDADVLRGLSEVLEPAQLATLDAVLRDDLGFSPERGRGAISYVSRQWTAAGTQTTAYVQPHFLAAYGPTA